MRFEQTTDILKHYAIEYHHKVAAIYEEFGSKELTPRNRMMLDYLIDNERRMAQAIDDFMANITAKKHDHWFKQVEIPFPAPDIKILTDECSTDLDQLLGVAIKYKTALMCFYDQVLQQCDDKETANLFQGLRNQEENGMKRTIRHSQGLYDL